MKLRTDKDILRLLAIGIGMILAGIVLELYAPVFIGGGFILGGAAFTIMVLYIATKPKEEVMEDERSAKVMDRAGHHAFWIVLNLIIILTLADTFDILSVEFRNARILILFIGIYSFLILRWHYNKKGDVQ
ncbi:MAG: DUF2178 domain-containing protein [Candidatus Methanoperedens sp.]|nr:DUF2178 domain-containing protein [Candidatus Methanoperedens sp.]